MATFSSTMASAPANEVTVYSTTPTVGINLDRRSTSPQFDLGHVVHVVPGLEAVYVKAGDAVAAAGRANVNGSTWVTTANVSGTLQATAAFAANEYGWMKRYLAEIV